MKIKLLIAFLFCADLIFAQGGIINTYAGNGTYTSTGDGGQATAATLKSPAGICFDAAGNLYITEGAGHKIRKVTKATGIITTIAGTGTAAYTGNGGQATAATFNSPTDIVMDGAGNLFVCDQYNHSIRKIIVSTGVISTFAGTGAAGFTGDGGAATAAKLNMPNGVGFDVSGNLLITDEYNARVRMVTMSTGVITTIAGNGTQGFTGDGAQATAAELSRPTAVCADAAGNILIADYGNSTVRKITTSTGVITTLAGTGTQGYSGDGGQATAAKIASPYGIRVDNATGNIYISDTYDNRIRLITVSTGVISTICGTGVAAYGGDGSPAVAAKINTACGIVFDAAGDLFIADNQNFRVRVIGAGALQLPSTFSYIVNAPSLGVSAICPKDSCLIFEHGANAFFKVLKYGYGPLWEKSYPNFTDAIYNGSLVSVNDTTFCAVGNASSNDNMVVTKFTASGALVADKKYTGIVSQVIKGVATTNQNLFTVSLVGQGIYKIVKINPALAVSGAITLTVPNEISGGNKIAFAKVNNNRFVMAADLVSNDNLSNGMLVCAIDSSLNLLWSRYISNPDYTLMPYDITSDGNRTFITSTFKNFKATDQDILITCINNSGNVLWNKTFGVPTANETPNQITVTKDSLLMVCGNTITGTATTGFITKINRNGSFDMGRQYLPGSGYASTNILQVYAISPSSYLGHYSTVTTGTNPAVRAGYMKLNASLSTGCNSTPLYFTERAIALQNTHQVMSSVAIAMPVATESLTPTNTTYTVAQICSSSCQTQAMFNVPITRVCKGASISLQSQSVNATSYNWLVNGVSVGTTPSFTYTTIQTGLNHITLVATGASCTDSITRNLFVDVPPVASFTNTQQSLDAYFTCTSANVDSAWWTFGDGKASGLLNYVNHTYLVPGTYSVNLTVRNSCGNNATSGLFKTADLSVSQFQMYLKAYGGDQLWAYPAICESPSGNVVAAFSAVGSSSVVVVAEVNKNGKIVKQGQGASGLPRKITRMGGVGYLVCAKSGNAGSLSRMDTSFSFYYKNTYTLANADFNDCVMDPRDSTIYTCGSTTLYSGKAIFTKTDRYLNQKWLKISENSTAFKNLVLVKGGKIILGGSNATNGITLVKADTSGKMLWSKTYTVATTGGLTFGHLSYDTMQNRIYVTGAQGTTNYFIMKCDTAGNILWRRTFNGQSDGWFGSYANQYGHVFLGGTPLIKLDTAGNYYWNKSYGIIVTAQGGSGILGSAPTYDGGIIGVGFTDKTCGGCGLYDGCLIRVDTSGSPQLCYVGTYTTAVQTNSALSMFATPADSLGILTDTYTTGATGNGYTFTDSLSCFLNSNCAAIASGFTSTNAQSTYTFTANYTNTGASYAWTFGDGGTSTQANPTHMYPGPGTYTVCLTVSQSGCSANSNSCVPVTIATTDVNRYANGKYIYMYPNPAQNSLTLTCSSDIGNLIIFNAIGETVLQLNNAKSEEVINVSNFNSGIYFIKTTAGIQRFIKE
jgi:PKD repeat protein